MKDRNSDSPSDGELIRSTSVLIIKTAAKTGQNTIVICLRYYQAIQIASA